MELEKKKIYKVLWGVKKNNSTYLEEVLLEGLTLLKDESIINHALKEFKNYSNFRILKLKGDEKPNFLKVII